MKDIKISVITSLYRCEIYLESYLIYTSQIDNLDEVEFLLILNDGTDRERDIIKNYIKGKETSYVLIEVPREPLYATWNRGVAKSKGEYCAIWNVDDVRTPDSLSKQFDTLVKNPKAVLTYGDYYCVKHYGDTDGVRYYAPSADSKLKYVDHVIGPFPMWKKLVHNVVGYFDEQFKLVGDTDFQYRLVNRFDIVKTEALLGYFLEGVGNEGRLSQNFNRSMDEKMIMYRRYHLYKKFFFPNFFSSKKIGCVKQLLFFGEYKSLYDMWDLKNTSIIRDLLGIILSIIKLPRHYYISIKKS